MKRAEISSGVVVALLKNKHQVAETDFTVGLTGRTVVRMQRTREGIVCHRDAAAIARLPRLEELMNRHCMLQTVDLCSSRRTGTLIHRVVA